MRKAPINSDDVRPIRGEAAILRIIEASSNPRRTKSVSTPSAQTTTLCSPGQDTDKLLKELVTISDSLKIENRVVYRIFMLQMYSGCRISEILDICPGDISRLGKILIKGKKGSNDKWIDIPCDKEYFLKCRTYDIMPFEGISRFFVYREYKKRGIGIKVGKTGKKAVTHMFRHLMGKIQEDEGFDINSTKKALGHKSIKSTNYYRNEKNYTKTTPQGNS